MLLYALIAASLALALRGLFTLLRLRPPVAIGPAYLILGEGMGVVVLLISAAVMGRIEKRALADYALPGRGAFQLQFWQGVGWGFLSLSALLLVIGLLGDYTLGSLALHGKQLAYYAGAWAFGFLAVGFFEEFLVRGYALYTLTTGMGFWASAFLLSAAFGALHLGNSGESWVGVLSASLIGVFFCFTVRRTGSLWFAIGFHAMWDYSESFLYSVADSGVMLPGHLLNSSFRGPVWLTGGATGPEGSVLIFPTIAALFVVFSRLHPQVRFPLRPTAPVSASADLPPLQAG